MGQSSRHNPYAALAAAQHALLSEELEIDRHSSFLASQSRSHAANLRIAFDDAAAVTEDALRPLRKRDLRHVEHRRLYTEAKQKIATLLIHAEPPPEANSNATLAGEPRQHP